MGTNTHTHIQNRTRVNAILKISVSLCAEVKRTKINMIHFWKQYESEKKKGDDVNLYEFLGLIRVYDMQGREGGRK